MKASYLLPAAALLTTAAGGFADPPPAGGVVLILTDFRVVEGAVPAKNGDYQAGAEVVPGDRVVASAPSRAEAVRQLAAVAAAGRAKMPPSAAGRGFAARVQPVLSNLCAGCHARPDHPGEFVLARVADGYADPDGVAANVVAAARFVSRTEPGQSPLLDRAATAHGGQKRPALPGRAHPAYRALEAWAFAAATPSAP